jgi:GxxExxY protein
MNTDGRKYVENDLVYKITGCAMAVLNELGHGLREKTYERALCVEFKRQNIAFDQQHVHPVNYRGEHIDDYIPDLEVEGRAVVEAKTVETITDEHVGQLINYLRVTGYEVGVILNFKHSKLEWKKVVLTDSGKS